jgi:hypothetical protein
LIGLRQSATFKVRNILETSTKDKTLIKSYCYPSEDNMVTNKTIPKIQYVNVSRQIVEESGDLREFIDRVYSAVHENYRDFDGNDAWDLTVEEVGLRHVVVHNWADHSYVRAMMEVDEDIEFSNFQRVKKNWVPVETVERADIQTIPMGFPTNSSLWGSVLG